MRMNQGLFLPMLLIIFSGCVTQVNGGRTVQDLPEARLESISASLLMGDPDKAIDAYDRAFKDAPENTATQILHARLLILARRFDDAKKEIAEVLAKEPANTEALFAQALIAGLDDDKKKQKEILEKIVSIDATHVEALAAMGSLSFGEKNYAYAKEIFLDVNKKDDKNLVALIGLGNICYKEKNYQQAKEYFDRAIDVEPDYPFSYSDRALVRRRLGDSEGALADLNTAVKLDPEYGYNYYDRGRIFMERGKWELAVDQFSQAIQKDPEMFLAYVMRAGLYDDMNKIDPAITDYEMVIKLKSDYFYAYSALGTLLMLSGKYDRASAMFDTASTYEKDLSEYILLAALALKKAGKQSDAVKYINEKLPLIPRYTWCYEVAQFYINPAFDINAVSAANQEKNQILRAKILFYIAEQYLFVNKKMAARTYLYEAASLERQGVIEKRLAKHELEQLKAK